jgi:hypothetical protein
MKDNPKSALNFSLQAQAFHKESHDHGWSISQYRSAGERRAHIYFCKSTGSNVEDSLEDGKIKGKNSESIL